MPPIGIAAREVEGKHDNGGDGGKRDAGRAAWRTTCARSAASRNAGRSAANNAPGKGGRTGRIESRLRTRNGLRPTNLGVDAAHSTARRRIGAALTDVRPFNGRPGLRELLT